MLGIILFLILGALLILTLATAGIEEKPRRKQESEENKDE